jgi:ribosomal protein S18 acetylase RimI-like enzyme
VEVRPVRAGEWEAYREVRLRALREAPYAFSTTYEEASQRDDDAWREATERIASHREWAGFVLDRGDGRLAGLVSVHVEGAGAELNQMWLDEDLRGLGHAEALVAAAEDLARSRGVTRLELWVEEDNPRAARFYERLGYRLTGEGEPNPRGGRTLQMARQMASADANPGVSGVA